MRRRPGADEAAGLLPVAGDAVLGDQALDQAERVGAVRQHRARPFRFRIEALAGEALADIHPAADAAAIARAGAEAEFGGFQHDAVDALLRRLQRGRQPAIAAADDRHAHPRRQVDRVQRAVG
jgi:hypothetical protein